MIWREITIQNVQNKLFRSDANKSSSHCFWLQREKVTWVPRSSHGRGIHPGVQLENSCWAAALMIGNSTVNTTIILSKRLPLLFNAPINIHNIIAAFNYTASHQPLCLLCSHCYNALSVHAQVLVWIGVLCSSQLFGHL